MHSPSRSANPCRTLPRQLRWLERTAKRVLLAGLLTVLGMPLASAGPIAVGTGSGGGTVSQFTYQTDYASWLVADLSDPVTPAPLEIAPGLSAGRWTQELAFGQGFSNLQTGDTFFLQELLTIGSGDFLLNNWFQQILTPGWQWSSGAIFDGNTSDLLSGLQVNLSPSRAAFTFDPVSAGTELVVVKVLEYIGPDDAAPTPITIQAYTAVPEPGTVTLLVAGVVALFGTRLRRSVSPNA